jgi:hypothetical protein
LPQNMGRYITFTPDIGVKHVIGSRDRNFRTGYQFIVRIGHPDHLHAVLVECEDLVTE